MACIQFEKVPEFVPCCAENGTDYLYALRRSSLVCGTRYIALTQCGCCSVSGDMVQRFGAYFCAANMDIQFTMQTKQLMAIVIALWLCFTPDAAAGRFETENNDGM